MRKLVKVLGNALLVLVAVAAVAYAGLQASGQLTAVMVRTGSMEPTAPVGSLVLGWVTETPQVGDVVTAHRADGQRVTHRVVEALPGGEFRMRGDANQADDAGTYSIDDGAHRVFLVVPHVGRVVGAVTGTALGNIGLGAVSGCLLSLALVGGVARVRRPVVPDGTGRHRLSAGAREDASVTTSTARAGV